MVRNCFTTPKYMYEMYSVSIKCTLARDDVNCACYMKVELFFALTVLLLKLDFTTPV